MSPKHVASCSFGKDSIATILLALEHGEPLDEAVYCEVMFDDATSGEVPEHQAFIYQAAIPALEKLGVPVRVLRSEKTYTSVFMGKVTRGPKKDMIRSFPVCGKCYVQRDCKMHPIRQYQKTLPSDTVQYIGIAKDEPQRLARLGGNQVSLLEKYGYTEDDAKQLCKQVEPHPVKRTEKKYKVFPVSSRALLAAFYAARQSACFSIGVRTPRLR